MEKKTVSGMMLTLLLIGTLTLAFDIQPVKADPKTIYVNDDNTGGPWDGTPEHSYQNITSALKHASVNDTIYVYNGTYYENVIVNKTVSLIGENSATTTIDGSGIGIVVSVKEPDVEIRGFTIQNGGKTIIDCGIYVANHTGRISNNIVRNNYNGIWLLRSNGSNIIGNTIRDNTWAVHISDSSESIIHSNTIANNSIGAWISSPSSVLNAFYHNNFIDNPNQASDFGFNTVWDNGYPSGGNFWSDYTGADLYSGPYQNKTGSDGIGDTPYIPSGDKYPLMSPWKMIPIRGDVNFDGMVDIFDVVLVALAFGSAVEDDPNTPWNETKNWNPYADLKKDGIIDIFDLVTVGLNFGKRLPL